MRRCGKGFTLIELLVVIAIIAILAAMLFPVFARARESARKIQCLSNVKNIALAVQMYLTDYDRFPPLEHRPEVRSFIIDHCSADCDEAANCRGMQGNPYLRTPVILDEYIRNRDVWRCPSARFVNTFGVNWGYGVGDWFGYLTDMGMAGCSPGICNNPFPTGWGGSITDSFVQQACGGPENGGFEQSIAGLPYNLYDMKTAGLSDPSKWVVCSDGGSQVNWPDRTSWVAYPEVCRLDQCGSTCKPSCGADWVNCSWSQDCGALKGDPRWSRDPQFRKDNAGTRHLGGSNIGFADGHAAWMASEAILFGGENWSGYGNDTNLLMGIGVCIVPE